MVESSAADKSRKSEWTSQPTSTNRLGRLLKPSDPPGERCLLLIFGTPAGNGRQCAFLLVLVKKGLPVKPAARRFLLSVAIWFVLEGVLVKAGPGLSARVFPGESEPSGEEKNPAVSILPQTPAIPTQAEVGWAVPSPLAASGTGKVQSSLTGDWGSLTSNVQLAATDWSDPMKRWGWQRDDSVSIALMGPWSFYGQLGANSNEAAQSDMKISGKTGLVCKMPLYSNGEIQLRSGPTFSCSDPLRDLSQARSSWLLEIAARYPLVWGWGLEYQGTATPALTPTDHDQLNQDLRLALPIGPTGKVRLGARHQTVLSPTDPRPFSLETQLYLGVELAR